MSMGDSKLGAVAKSARAPVSGAIGATAIITLFGTFLDLFPLRSDIQSWLVASATAVLFASWPWITKRSRGLLRPRDRATDKGVNYKGL